VATAIGMRGAPGGGTHIDYDDGTSIDTGGLSPTLQGLVGAARMATPLTNPSTNVAPPVAIQALRNAVAARTRGTRGGR
jgi:hypothetical protein